MFPLSNNILDNDDTKEDIEEVPEIQSRNKVQVVGRVAKITFDLSDSGETNSTDGDSDFGPESDIRRRKARREKEKRAESRLISTNKKKADRTFLIPTNINQQYFWSKKCDETFTVRISDTIQVTVSTLLLNLHFLHCFVSIYSCQLVKYRLS